MTHPGTVGEQRAQKMVGSMTRALAFYQHQVFKELNPLMQKYISNQEMVCIATSDSKGECDASFRAGGKGFIKVLDDRILLFPEYRGNGVMASVGNILENPHIGMIFLDFFDSTVGLHVNGRARIVTSQELGSLPTEMSTRTKEILGNSVPKPECWVWVDVQEAFIHCSKHIPLLEKRDKKIHWGTDEEGYKTGDFFKSSGEEKR